jgi:hypothetical protein
MFILFRMTIIFCGWFIVPSGRWITSKGQKELDTIAKQVLHQVFIYAQQSKNTGAPFHILPTISLIFHEFYSNLSERLSRALLLPLPTER